MSAQSHPNARPEPPEPTRPRAGPGARRIDAFPRDPRVLATLSPEERSAVYLNSIRRMFQVLLFVGAIGVGAGTALAVITIETINSLGHCGCSVPF